MSVAVAITVTLPNTTAALIKMSGTDVAQVLGKEVIRLVQDQVDNFVPISQQGVATVSASVT